LNLLVNASIAGERFPDNSLFQKKSRKIPGSESLKFGGIGLSGALKAGVQA
jgi:hypothetical protein